MRASPHSAGGGSGCPGTPWRSRLNRTPWLRRLGPRVRFDLNCIRPPQPSPAIVSHQVQKSRGRKRQTLREPWATAGIQRSSPGGFDIA